MISVVLTSKKKWRRNKWSKEVGKERKKEVIRDVWMNVWMTEDRPVRSACQKERMKKTADLWDSSHREMNRTRRRHTDGIKAFTILSYRCESRHVSPPSFMAILQKFGVALLIHTSWAVLIEPLHLATIQHYIVH